MSRTWHQLLSANWINFFHFSWAKALHWFPWLAKRSQRSFVCRRFAAIRSDVNNIKWFRCELPRGKSPNQKPIATFEFHWQPSNATSSSGAPSNVTTVIPLDEEAETTQRVPSAFELKDYDETTLEPDVEANRVRREASTRSNHGLRRSEDDSDDEAESTTTIAIPLEELASSEANLASLSPPPTAVASSHHNFYHIPSIGFPYPPSKFPSAEFVSITQSPLNRQRASVKNYYDFYPSQVDYNYHHFNPYCISYGHKSFNSFDQSTWLNNRKWRK